MSDENILMRNSRVTQHMRITLVAIAAGEVKMANCGTAAFRIFGAAGPVVGACVKKGYACWPLGPVGEQVCEVTEVGKAALAEAEATFSQPTAV